MKGKREKYKKEWSKRRRRKKRKYLGEINRNKKVIDGDVQLSKGDFERSFPSPSAYPTRQMRK